MKLDQNEFTVRIRYSAFAWIYEAANNNEFLECIVLSELCSVYEIYNNEIELY